MDTVVYLPENHFRIFVFEDLLCSLSAFPLSPAVLTRQYFFLLGASLKCLVNLVFLLIR